MIKLSDLSVIDEIKSEIRSVYLNYDYPIIIGYSGGKDSTTVLQLVVEVLFELKKENIVKQHVYVISADTFVENPLVIDKTKKSMMMIDKFVKENGLPMSVKFVYPKTDKTFFVNLIGRGYPPPLKSFRWCTDRLKINPANDFIKSMIDKNGEIIMMLGTRKQESISRKLNMEKHEVDNSVLSLHSTFNSAWTYAPIRDLQVDELWNYLTNNKCPWGEDNSELYKMYSDSSGECPLMIDEQTKKQSTCGNSRFGCWTCTVVSEDKSLSGFIDSGHEYLRGLLNYRNYMMQIREDSNKRNLFDKRGNLKLVNVELTGDVFIIPKKLNREKYIYELKNVLTESEALDKISSGEINPLQQVIIISKNNKYYKIGVSSFNIETRIDLLKKLLEVENELNEHIEFELISKNEIIRINELWKEDGQLCSAIEIYNELKGSSLKQELNYDYELLKEVCLKNDMDFKTVCELFNFYENNYSLKNRDSSFKFIENRLKQFKFLVESSK